MASYPSVQYLSDLHLEYPTNSKWVQKNPIKAVSPLLVMAGDIVPFSEMDDFNWFFDEVSREFEQVFWIPGNHGIFQF